MVEACDHTKLDRVGENEDYRRRYGCRLGGQCRGWTSRRKDHRYVTMNQLGSQCRQPVVMALGPAERDCDVLAVNVASLFQTRAKAGDVILKWLRGGAVEKPDHRHRWLLCERGERPRDANETGEEIASLHWRCPLADGSGYQRHSQRPVASGCDPVVRLRAVTVPLRSKTAAIVLMEPSRNSSPEEFD